MDEFEVIKKALERVGAIFTIFDYSNINSKSICFDIDDGELELEFDGNGRMVDVTFWS